MPERHHELRCEGNKFFGELIEGALEVKCDSRFCGAGPGIVVLHRFSFDTGEVTTQRFRNPPLPSKEQDSAD